LDTGFDPYKEWLGLPPGQRPPDHYTLLGLPPLESDPRRIAQAADVQSAKVRRVRPGVHLAEWSRLLDRIQAAKTCLLNPASKAAYDATLRSSGGSPGAAPPASRPGATGSNAPVLATPPGLSPPSQSEPSSLSGSSPAHAGPAGSTPSMPHTPSVGSSGSVPAEPSPMPGTAQPGATASGNQGAWSNGPSTAFPSSAGRSQGAGVPSTGSMPRPAQPPFQTPATPWPPSGGQSPPPTPPAGPGAADQSSPQPTSTQPASTSPPANPWLSAPAPLAASAPTQSGGPQSQTPGASVGPAATTGPAPHQGTPPAGVQPASGAVPRAIPIEPISHSSAWAPALTAAIVVLIVALGAGFVYYRYSQMGLLGADGGVSEAQQAGAADSGDSAESGSGTSGQQSASAQSTRPSSPESTANSSSGTGGSSPGQGGLSAGQPRPGEMPAPAPGTPDSPSVQPGSGPEQGTGQDNSFPPAAAALGQPTGSGQSSPGTGSSGSPSGQGSAAQDGQNRETEANAEDPQKRAAFDQAVAEVWRLLGQRDLAGARRQLVAAERVAQSQPDLDRVTRLETMVNVLEEFWKGMREAVASLDAGVELKVGETYVAVVESSRERLLIKTAGRLRSWAVEDLPSVLVLSVAEEFFREDAVKKLLIGAFLC